MDAPDVEVIRRAFFSTLPEPDRGGAPPGVSAVLLPVFATREGPALLYTRRTESLRSHPGEISFPGGRVDPSDPTPLAAALRETEEEVGIAPRDVEVLGHLTDYLTYRNVLVCAYVGVVGRVPPTEPRSRDEVDEVFTVPVTTLLDASTYEARRIDGMAPDARVHYWRVGGRVIWGITGELTARFLQHVHGWAPPPDVRTVTSPEEFRPSRRPRASPSGPR